MSNHKLCHILQVIQSCKYQIKCCQRPQWPMTTWEISYALSIQSVSKQLYTTQAYTMHKSTRVGQCHCQSRLVHVSVLVYAPFIQSTTWLVLHLLTGSITSAIEETLRRLWCGYAPNRNSSSTAETISWQSVSRFPPLLLVSPCLSFSSFSSQVTLLGLRRCPVRGRPFLDPPFFNAA